MSANVMVLLELKQTVDVSIESSSKMREFRIETLRDSLINKYLTKVYEQNDGGLWAFYPNNFALTVKEDTVDSAIDQCMALLRESLE